MQSYDVVCVSSQYSGENGECRSDLLSDQAAVSKTALHLPRFIEKILVCDVFTPLGFDFLSGWSTMGSTSEEQTEGVK